MGWDITVSAQTDSHEAIARVEVMVDGFSRYDEDFNPPVHQWTKILTQQGEYPGDNKAELVITDINGNDTRCVEEWN